MDYDYKNAKKRIDYVFDNQLIKSESQFTPNIDAYQVNGTKSWIGVISISFYEINSVLSKLDDHKKTQVIKTLYNEMIIILKSVPKLYNLLINKDGIVAIYGTQFQSDLLELYDAAVTINTFSKMFNEILVSHDIVSIPIGIGLSADKEIIIKLSESNDTYINDLYWLGDSIEIATMLSQNANKRSIKSIVISKTVFDNIIKNLLDRNEKYKDWITTKYIENKPLEDQFIEFYHCDVIKTSFDNWISKGMNE